MTDFETRTDTTLIPTAQKISNIIIECSDRPDEQRGIAWGVLAAHFMTRFRRGEITAQEIRQEFEYYLSAVLKWCVK